MSELDVFLSGQDIVDKYFGTYPDLRVERQNTFNKNSSEQGT